MKAPNRVRMMNRKPCQITARLLPSRNKHGFTFDRYRVRHQHPAGAKRRLCRRDHRRSQPATDENGIRPCQPGQYLPGIASHRFQPNHTMAHRIRNSPVKLGVVTVNGKGPPGPGLTKKIYGNGT